MYTMGKSLDQYLKRNNVVTTHGVPTPLPPPPHRKLLSVLARKRRGFLNHMIHSKESGHRSTNTSQLRTLASCKQV